MKIKLRIRALLCIAVALLLCTVAAFTACSYAGGGDDWAPESGSGTIVTDTVNRKIVYRVRMNLEADDVASARDSITAKSGALGGYIEAQNEYSDGKEYYSISLVFRIPTDRLDEFLGAVDDCGKVYSRSVSTTDITTEYVNASAQKAALEERKAALTEILNDTQLSASDRVTVINEISEVNEQLQAIGLQLTEYDSLVDYSTVTVNIGRTETDVTSIILIVFLILLILGLVAGNVILSVKAKKWMRKAQETRFREGYNAEDPAKKE